MRSNDGHHYLVSLSRLVGFFILAWALVGCAANPTGGVNLVLMSEKKELELGAMVSKQIEAQQGVYEDEALTKYVNDMGQALVKVSHRPDIKYTFKIIDDDNVNAFALPGGYIYVTRGMLAHMNSEAELAAVLGHEIAHVTARHSVRKQSQAGVLGAAGTVASIATGTPGVSGLSGILGDVLIRGYGREYELEADEFGAEYMIKAGYSTDGMLK
ncbi:MAG: M48 family metallopeptidase, partial [Pseudomonadota bacterium]